MFKMLKRASVILGVILITTGCNNQIRTIEKTTELTNKEKKQVIIDTQDNGELNTEKTINLYGFEIPYSLINMDGRLAVNYEDTPYPYMTWFEEKDMLIIYLNVKYPENGGDTYRLENLLELKFDKKTVGDLMEKFKIEETKIIDFDDETYMIFSTATDGTRVVSIGNIENKPKQ